LLLTLASTMPIGNCSTFGLFPNPYRGSVH
jgi:hypothetical protein